jgi:unsaturated rhamnogalacturonyl hydrolase
MAESFVKRNPETIAYAEDPRSDRWTYEQGVMLEALRQLWSRTKDQKYASYIRRNIDRFVTDDGTIRTYEYEAFNLDNVATGRALLHLHACTGDEKYRVAAQTLMKQLANQPRTASGGFWHKKIYPNQMWLDGLYMAEPFYAAYAQHFGGADAFDDIARQFALTEAHTRDSVTGLLYHAWDESRQQRWADPVTGHSPNFWGRAIGWYAMALVDMLDYFPAEHPQRTEMIEILRRLAAALLRSRDRETALWYQVVDMPGRAGNYLESSASCMFTYAFAKGARKGYLEAEFRKSARESFEGILKHKVTVDSLGLLSLHDVCQVGGLGGDPYRDGSYEYYTGEKRRTND